MFAYTNSTLLERVKCELPLWKIYQNVLNSVMTYYYNYIDTILNTV